MPGDENTEDAAGTKNSVAAALDRARLSRERRDADQAKRLDDLRAQATAAQAQLEKREEERRQRLAEQRQKDEERRQQVEDRKRAIVEDTVAWREALYQREKERTERIDRLRAARTSPRPEYAFGSSTPRLLEPVDTSGCVWAARSMESVWDIYHDNPAKDEAASTTNVMYASAPLTRHSSSIQLNSDDKDDAIGQPSMVRSSVARRRTDLMPAIVVPRTSGRAHSMTRLDRIAAPRPLRHSASPSLHQLNKTQSRGLRSGDTSPGSRPSSAMSTSAIHRSHSVKMRPRSAIEPQGADDAIGQPGVTKPSVARRRTDHTPAIVVPRTSGRAHSMTRLDRITAPRPLRHSASPSLHQLNKTHSRGLRSGDTSPGSRPSSAMSTGATHRSHSVRMRPRSAIEPQGAGMFAGGEGAKPPDCATASSDTPRHEPRRPRPVSLYIKPSVAPKPNTPKPPIPKKPNLSGDKTARANTRATSRPRSESPVKNELQQSVAPTKSNTEEAFEVPNFEGQIEKISSENGLASNSDLQTPNNQEIFDTMEIPIITTEPEAKAALAESGAELIRQRREESRRIITEEEAKAALAEKRRKVREEQERQAELEKLRLQQEAEEEAERLRQEELRQRRDEEEARELAELSRKAEEAKLLAAIEARQEEERVEALRKEREATEKAARLKEEEEKRLAAWEAERLRKEEAEREEKERLARRQRVEAIMARTRIKKAEEEKKQQAALSPAAPSQPDNGNPDDMMRLENTFVTSQIQEPRVESNNGNVVDPLKLAVSPSIAKHESAKFIETEKSAAELVQVSDNAPKLIEDDFTAHNGHNKHPLTLQNAI